MSYREKISAFLVEASEPVDVEKIRKSCGIGNWNTAMKHCLELVIDGKIMGQKTSKGWIFWTYQETRLRPWEEAIGTYETLEVTEDKIALTVSRTSRDMKLTFPKDSPEAETLIKTLQNTPPGTKIAILKTENPQKPLIIRTLKEATVTHNKCLASLVLRRRILCVAFKGFELVALKFAFTQFGLRLWRCF